MPLLNYRTTVTVDKTLAEISRILSTHGARQIAIDYDGVGNPTALTFAIATPIGTRSFRLPANTEGVWRTLTNQHRAGQVQPRFATKGHAAQVTWRILKDWLEAQVAIIEAGMASLDEVLLPYLLADTGQTVYEEFKERRLLALPPAPGWES